MSSNATMCMTNSPKAGNVDCLFVIIVSILDYGFSSTLALC